MIKRLTSPLLFLTALAVAGPDQARSLAQCELSSGLAVSGNPDNGVAFSDMSALEAIFNENVLAV